VVLLLLARILFGARLEGTIKSVDAKERTVVVTARDGKVVTITVNSDAKITVDGWNAFLSDLMAGQRATVRHENGKASALQVTSTKKE
jgi:hypothetical protein